MNDNQSEHLSMYLTVNQFLKDNQSALAPVPDIAVLQQQLEDKIGSITDYAGISGSDTTGFTIEKGEERLALEAITLKVSRACAAYFLSVNQPGNLKLSDYTPSEIERKRDNDLYVDSKWLYGLAEPVKNHLDHFNSSADDVEGLKDAYEDFFAVIRLPKTKRDQKSAGTQMLERAFESANETIKQLDIYMATFEPVNAQLYLEYQSARAIDQTGGGSQNTKSGTLQGNGIANAAFAEGKLTADTGLLLYNNSTGPNAGNLQFYFSATATGAIQDPDKAITLGPGEDMATTALSMDYSVDKPFLNIFNPTAAEGKWKVVLTD